LQPNEHCLTTIDGDSLCWEQTITVLQYKYDCCSACEKRRCHYRALLKNAPICQPNMEKFIKERKGRAHWSKESRQMGKPLVA
jgi:hypothetical protein